MRITIATEDGKSTVIEVGDDETVENIKALIEVELGIPVNSQMLAFNGLEVGGNASLNSIGVKNNDLLYVGLKPNAPTQVPASSNATLSDVMMSFGGNPTPEQLLQTIGPNQQLMRELQHYNPDLAKSIQSGDVVQVRTTIMMQQMSQHKVKYEREQEDAALMSNPFDADAQAKIEERIKQENIENNMKLAMEEMPESFGTVFMLYINCEVNGKPVKAFVDSGAQSTIMNISCAQRLGIMRLVDRRFAGMAKGVGTAKIVGRVHMAQIKIGATHFGCTFTVMESQGVDLLFGLDMLKRHQCVIDLRRNVLSIGSASEEVPFLSESELPDDAKLGKEFSNTTSNTESKNEDSKQSSGSKDEALQNLVALGFPLERAKAVLAQCNGDSELAASILFAEDS